MKTPLLIALSALGLLLAVWGSTRRRTVRVPARGEADLDRWEDEGGALRPAPFVPARVPTAFTGPQRFASGSQTTLASGGWPSAPS